MSMPDYLWNPLLESAAQTIVGAIGAYSFSKVVEKMMARNFFEGPMDLWQRGLMGASLSEGDSIYMDCQLSAYSQLFPGNPFDNTKRWNTLYSFEGEIDKNRYQAMEFYAGSDAALRIGSINGETIVGLYHRHGFIGDGIVGVAPTSLLRKLLPQFFHSEFVGTRVRVAGKLARCPSQHGFIAQGIAAKCGIATEIDYKHLWYLQISGIKVIRKADKNTVSLLGSPWAVTESDRTQYLIQYGYISNKEERADCVKKITTSSVWPAARVYYDEFETPSRDLSFKHNYIG